MELNRVFSFCGLASTHKIILQEVLRYTIFRVSIATTMEFLYEPQPAVPPFPPVLRTPTPRFPKCQQKQLWAMLDALRCGRRLTSLESALHYGVMALSQRMGELRKLDWPIQSRMVDTARGAKVKEYWLP